MASVWFWWHFHSFCFLKLLFAKKISSCSNSLNFEAKINCSNTSKPNVPKWRKTSTGLQFDVVHFNGPQNHLLSGGNLWEPCSSTFNQEIVKFSWTFVWSSSCYSPCKVLDPDSLEHPPRLGVEDGIWVAAQNLLEVGSIILGLKIPEDEALHLRKLRKYFLWSSGKGQARKGKGWLLKQKALKLKPLPRA